MKFKYKKRESLQRIFNFMVGIFLVYIQAGSQDLQNGTHNLMPFDSFISKVNTLEKESEFEQARSLILPAFEKYPDNWFDLAQELVYLNKKTERSRENLAIFKEGHQKGYFFFLHPQFPSCKAYNEYDDFVEITRVDMELRSQAIKESSVSWDIALPDNYSGYKNYPVVFILHGGGSTKAKAAEKFRSKYLQQHCIAVYVQSYLYYSYNTFGWKKDDPRAREGMRRCYYQIINEFNVDTNQVSFCGISAGATMAMDMFIRQVVPVKSVIAFCPSQPESFAGLHKIFNADPDQSAVLMIGDEDSEKRLAEIKETADIFQDIGLRTWLEVLPSLGHEYPPNLPVLLDEALTFINRDIDMAVSRPLRILKLKGNSYNIGLQYGRVLKGEINEMIECWKKLIETVYKLPADKAIELFLDKTNYISYINNLAPELLEEVKGIARGSELPFKTILAFQMSEEFELQGEKIFGMKCTALASSSYHGKPSLLAQNMDPPLFLHGYPTLLQIHNTETDIETMVLTVPGLIGLMGMGKQGIGVCCNGVSMLNSSIEGLPVAFVMRKLLELDNVGEAGSFLSKIQHATPQAYTLGDKSKVACFECSAGACIPYMTFKTEELILHTNFSINNRDFNREYIELLSDYGKTIDDQYYCPRFFMLYDLIEEAGRKLSVGLLKELLRLEEPPMHPVKNDETYGSMIMILRDNPFMLLNVHKNEGTFRAFYFDK